jgi:hypothetical protein
MKKGTEQVVYMSHRSYGDSSLPQACNKSLNRREIANLPAFHDFVRHDFVELSAFPKLADQPNQCLVVSPLLALHRTARHRYHQGLIWSRFTPRISSFHR